MDVSRNDATGLCHFSSVTLSPTFGDDDIETEELEPSVLNHEDEALHEPEDNDDQ